MNFIFDASLVLYLPLYTLDGDALMSRDAYGHLCTVVGAKWTPHGMLLDGNDDHCHVSDAPSLRCPDAVTVEAWVYPKSFTGENTILCKGAMGAGAGYAVCHSVNNDGKVRFIIAWGAWPDEVALDAAAAMKLDDWNHVACTYDGTTMKIFWNAVADKNTAQPASYSTGTAMLRMGTNPGAGGSWYSGQIAEVRVYHRALSQLEIQHNYLATKWRYR